MEMTNGFTFILKELLSVPFYSGTEGYHLL